MQATAIGTGAGDSSDESQGFKRDEDTGDGKAISLRMIDAACIDVEDAVVSFFAKAYPEEVRALVQDAIAQRMTAFGFPIRCLPRFWMFGIDIVVAMWEECEKFIFPLLDGLKLFSGGDGNDTKAPASNLRSLLLCQFSFDPVFN